MLADQMKVKSWNLPMNTGKFTLFRLTFKNLQVN